MMLISILLKASVLLAAIYLIHAAFARRMSAAMRHWLWSLAIIGLLLLPVLALALPGWTVLELPAPPVSESVRVVESNPVSSPVADDSAVAGKSASPRVSAIPWALALPVLYAAGVWLLLARVILERYALQRLVRRAAVVDDADWTALLHECAGRVDARRTVRLLRSPQQTMPMAFGTVHPTVVIPADADRWTPGRRRAVLLHELAHVARYDCLMQTLAATACAFYWMHPMVWSLARRLRVERELACDDCVLMAGTKPREYAEDLLELAYTLGNRRAPAPAVSMAASSQIEGRMLAVLDDARNRTTPAWPLRALVVVTAIALLVPLAGATTAAGRSSMSVTATAEPALAFAQRGALAAPQNPGTWEIRAGADTRTVHLRLSEGDGSHGSTVDVEQLSGLPPAMLTGAGGQVQFTLRRDAGSFHFEGIFRGGVGAGTYTFAPSADFAAALEKRGLARPTPGEQYFLARVNFSFAFLDELAAQKYARPDLPQLIRALQHGVSANYLREMGQLGYRLNTIDALVTLRDHGVSPQYVREMAAEGLKGLSADDLVRGRDHGVSPEYVRELRTQGHQGLALDALIRLRDHGVSPQYLRELAALGYEKLPLETVVQLRNHGVSPEYVRELRTLGYQNLSIDALIRLRNHGVSPAYVRELNDLGYKGLTMDDLVGLRDHGMSPERIRTANSRAGTRLSVDALKTAASHGWR